MLFVSAYSGQPTITMGISPGISSASFCVLMFNQRGIRVMDYDVLIGTRPTALRKFGEEPASTASTVDEIAHRFHVHTLLLQTICERHVPCVLAIGPSARPKEPPNYLKGALKALRMMATEVCHLPLVEITKSEIHTAFGGEKLVEAVQARLDVPIGSSDRRVMLAAGAAYVAGQRIHTQRSNLLASHLAM